MKTSKNTTLSPHLKKVQKFRGWVAKEIVKNNRKKRSKHIGNKPYMGFTADNKTKRIILSYLIPMRDASCKRNGGIRMVKKQKYLSNWTLDNYIKDRFDVLNWYSFICDEVELYQKECFIDEGSLEYWIEQYCSPLPRRGIKKIPTERTRVNEKRYLDDYKLWLKKNHREYLQIWAHNDDKVREVCKEYLRFKTLPSEHTNKDGKVIKSKGWGESTTFNSYRIIRAMLNWISMKLPHFKANRLSSLDIEKPKPNLETFTNIEFQKVIEFMEEYKDSNRWGWFIPILEVMLVTGCRISEVTMMRVNELNFTEVNGKKIVEWTFRGKGNKERTIYIDSSTCYSYILDSITDDKGRIRTDKEWVFHKRFFKGGNRLGQGAGVVEDINEHFTISGIQHKFKKMVKFLKLNEKLTPHSTRRFFITEKLLESGGDIPFTALLVGHSSFSQVNHYQKHNQQSEMLLGRRNTLNFSEVIKRKKGIKYDKSK